MRTTPNRSRTENKRSTLHKTLLFGLALIASFACAGATKQPTTNDSLKNAPPASEAACTRTISPAEAEQLPTIIDSLGENSVLCFAAGRYPQTKTLLLHKTISLRSASGEVILAATAGAPIFDIAAEKIQVKVTGMTLTGGAGSETIPGGVLFNTQYAEIEFADCILTGNSATGGGGAVVWATSGKILFTRCRLVGNQGVQGGAIAASGAALVTLRDSLVAENQGSAQVKVTENAGVVIERSTVVGDLIGVELSGNPVQHPELTISDSILMGKQSISQSGAFAVHASVARSVLFGIAIPYTDGGEVRTTDPAFATGGERYRPGPGSPAIGLGGPTNSALDVTGAPRRTTASTAGAYETR